MPNWCDNTLNLTHEDPSQIDRAIEAFKQESCARNFTLFRLSCWKTLELTLAGTTGASTTGEPNGTSVVKPLVMSSDLTTTTSTSLSNLLGLRRFNSISS